MCKTSCRSFVEHPADRRKCAVIFCIYREKCDRIDIKYSIEETRRRRINLFSIYANLKDCCFPSTMRSLSIYFLLYSFIVAGAIFCQVRDLRHK